MMFKHYYPLIPIRRPLQLLACAAGCFLAGAYYLYRNSSWSKEDSEPEAESSLDISDELITINHNFSTLTLFGVFESYLLHRPHLTSSRLNLLDDEAGGAKKRKGASKYNYSSTTSECTTDLSGDKLDGSDPPVDFDESSFGDVVLVLKDDKERNFDVSSDTSHESSDISHESSDTSHDSSDTSDDTREVSPINWLVHDLSGEEERLEEEEEERRYEIEHVEFYDIY